MDTVLSTITVMPENKQEKEVYIQMAKKELKAGNQPALKIWKQLKIMESIIKELLKDEEIRDQTMAEASRYSAKSFEDYNCKFQVKGGRPTFDFSVCNDTEYDLLVTEFNNIKTKKEAREKFLKGLDENTINQETGEIINPPIKKQSEIISLTLK